MYFPPKFNQKLAIELGQLVEQAYDQFEAFEKQADWQLPSDYQLVSELHYSDTSAFTDFMHFDFKKLLYGKKNKPELPPSPVPIGFIAERGTETFIILRGTQTPSEWVNNLTIILKHYFISDFGSVHDGFLSLYKSIQAELRAGLAKTKSGHKVFIAGHSLGAALVTLAVPDIDINLKKDIQAIYTFASPRVGDDTFVQAFNRRYQGRSFRVVNTSDVITSMPLPVPMMRALGGYFSHVDTPVDFTHQVNDVSANHCIATYLTQLKNVKEGWFSRLARGLFS